MASLIDQARQYIAAHGGHASVAPTIGVKPGESEAICQGLRRVTSGFAVGMAPLIGCNVPQLLSADADAQLLARRGAIS